MVLGLVLALVVGLPYPMAQCDPLMQLGLKKLVFGALLMSQLKSVLGNCDQSSH
jgi:hypothetical protein